MLKKDHCYWCQLELWGTVKVSQWNQPILTFAVQNSSVSKPLSQFYQKADLLMYEECQCRTSIQEQGLSQVYYWISVLTFNLFLWEWLLFSKEQAHLGLCAGLVGHKHPHRDLGVMEHQYMVNIHDKSPVRQVLIPPTKHRGQDIILEARLQQEQEQKPEKMTRVWTVFFWQIEIWLGTEILHYKWQMSF